jgi:glutaredoxin-related protein
MVIDHDTAAGRNAGAAPVVRPLLPDARMTREAARFSAEFHASVVHEVEQAVLSSPIVVVGMAWNAHVRNVSRALTDAKLTFRYLEYGSYVSMWRARLAIKLWSGWPTFPQVFVRGVLFGGEDLTLAALADGSLRKTLDQP